MKALKNTIAAIAVGSTAILPMTTSAQAHDRHYAHIHKHGPVVKCGPRNNYCRPVVRKKVRSNNDAAAAAIIAGVGGLIIGSAIANSNKQRRYVTPRPTYNHNTYPAAPAPVQRKTVTYSSLEPWSQGWYQYCDNRYRSFNAKTGTYRGYDGRDHFCVPK